MVNSRHNTPLESVISYRSQRLAIVLCGRTVTDEHAEDLIRRANECLDSGDFARTAQNLLQITGNLWGQIDVGLRLGYVSDIVAVRVEADKVNLWFELEMAMGIDTATVDAGDCIYALFSCETEHCSLSGQLADGITLLSGGDIIKLPPSIDSEGRYCCWIDDSPIMPLPEILVSQAINRFN